MSGSDSKHHSCETCPAWEHSVFRKLSPSRLESLAEHRSFRMWKRGELFSEQGKPVTEIYCLARGNCKVTRTNSGSRENRESIVRITGPGDLLGYRCVFSETAFRATASALGPVEGCCIGTSFFHELIQTEPPFAMEILRLMGREIASAENRHHSFCQKDARERIAEALLLLKEKAGVRQGRSWQLQISLTRQELSNWVGTAKETVIRCLSDFRDEGLIRQDDETIVILDPERLAVISGQR